MRTATPNLVILTTQIGTHITGTAIDADILINFAVANTEVNQRLFVPEAQLVVTGKFRLGKELATIGIWISSVVAIVSIPAPTSTDLAATTSPPVATSESAAEAETIVEPELASVKIDDSASLATSTTPKQTRAQKAAATRAEKKGKAITAAVPC